MNERIKELAKHAADYSDYYATISDANESDLFHEKFAELIVKECIELNRQELAFNAFERMLNRYQEHFGVE